MSREALEDAFREETLNRLERIEAMIMSIAAVERHGSAPKFTETCSFSNLTPRHGSSNPMHNTMGSMSFDKQVKPHAKQSHTKHTNRAVFKIPEGLKKQVHASLPPFTFFPENFFITIMDVFYWGISVIHFGYWITAVGNYQWLDPPRFWTVILLILSSIFLLFFVPLRTRVAMLDQWDLVDNPSELWKRYRRKWFFYDLLTAIPWDVIVLPGSVTAFRVLNTIRATHGIRLPHLFQSINPLIPSRTIHSIMLLMSAIIWGHLFFGFLWMLINSPSFERRGYSDSEILMTSLYWAVQTSTSVGYGDILPNEHDWGNRMLCSFAMLIGVGCYSYFISYMSVAVIRNDTVQQAIREKKAKLSAMMKHYNVPWHVQKQAYALYPRLLDTSRTDYADVVSSLPTFMQDQMHFFMKLKLVSCVPMFQQAEHEFLIELTSLLDNVLLGPSESVINEGDAGHEMYFVAHGVVEVLVRDVCGGTRQLALLKDGSWFGEIALLKETTRSATIRTVTACDLMVLEKESFLMLLKQFPESLFSKTINDEMARRSKLDDDDDVVDNSGESEGAFGITSSLPKVEDYPQILELVEREDPSFGRMSASNQATDTWKDSWDLRSGSVRIDSGEGNDSVRLKPKKKPRCWW